MTKEEAFETKITDLKAQLAAVSKRLEDAQSSYQITLVQVRELSGKNVILTDAVAELKGILFQKELAIAHSSGYISRIRELDTPREERLLTVPESKVVSQQFPNEASPAPSYQYNTWGLRWWDLGNEKKKER